MQIEVENKVESYSFIVMEQLGKTLRWHLKHNNGPFTTNKVCQIGLAILNQLEQLHSIGQIYNDLNLDNILVGDQDSSAHSIDKYALIDFGLCSGYLNSDGIHLPLKFHGQFKGNMALASANALEFKTTSRKDDLISLTYLLIYLSHGQFNLYSHLR